MARSPKLALRSFATAVRPTSQTGQTNLTYPTDQDAKLWHPFTTPSHRVTRSLGNSVNFTAAPLSLLRVILSASRFAARSEIAPYRGV